ncbi:hypothetical protein IMCC14465_11220 [alpha proteobacterium IMCC14465]|uniref:Metallo-beta-lactamase domain-containing protein n=1 Tax=alpha proteobacterium IMCC14465 TaxID=1220535 RepID=J9DHF3_9PROT|nr:hypothetical protein IMCC14465_11220 [alpha proteobacterium IMCC14465]
MVTTQQPTVKFWGTRGSLPVSGKNHVTYGGNTSCVEIGTSRENGQFVIIDAGSGLYALGESLTARKAQNYQKNYHICLSHFHLDHLMGIPFFAPLFQSDCSVHFHTITEDAPDGFEPVLNRLMSDPFFPIESNIFEADVQYHSHASGAEIDLGDVKLTTCPIPHPGGAHAYRVQIADKNIIYATDTEHETDNLNSELVAFSQNADLMLYDCTYDDNEFEDKKGFGHSTWQEAIRLAQLAHVKNLAIYHHDPSRTDVQLDEIEKKAQLVFKNSFVAADNQLFVLDNES